ncbi:MAG: dienelactone hydrolase family protein [Rhodospirillales bacterium]|nr:dienelactone hydrolase family protein [Rhodospirillales bacterium]MBO6786391.1 dienelactone hydrolase family protein [Rhodospirillales bacterium]
MRGLLTFLVVFGLATTVPGAGHAGETVDYSSDGMSLEGYKAAAKGTSKGLVLVIHDWDGLTDYEFKRADMLAEMGYDAFALDLYGKGNRPTETGAKKAEMGKLYNDREKMRSLILAGLAEARKLNSGKAVVMGYCFGGAATLELARSGKATDIAGYATFHGGLSTPEGQGYAANTPPIFVAHGGADTSITMDHVAALSKELEAAGVMYEIEVYSGAPHAFTVFGSNRYQKVADEKSWATFTEFLKTNL